MPRLDGIHYEPDFAEYHLYPTTASGAVAVAADAAADTYGNYVQVIPADTITTQFKLTGVAVVSLSGAADVFIVEITYGSGNILYTQVTAVGAMPLPLQQPIKSVIIPANSRVRARAQNATGGMTVNIFLQYAVN